MNSRLRELRKILNMSQEDFGKRIGVTKSAISKLETEDRNIKQQMIFLICREFNVRENWLRYGTGSTFDTVSEKNELDFLINEICSDKNELKVSILHLAAKIIHDDYCWNIIEKQLLQVIQQTSIDKSVASYRNELEAETKAVEKSEASLLPKEKNA